jgi:hypothetical protein
LLASMSELRFVEDWFDSIRLRQRHENAAQN